MLQVDEDNCLLNTFPTVNLVRADKAIAPKYTNIGQISFSDLSESLPSSANDVLGLLEDLPSYCVKNPQFGLGFTRTYRAIVHAIEALTDAEAIQVSQTRETGYDASTRTFILSADDMQAFCREIRRVNDTTRLAANEVNGTSTYNALAEVLGVPQRPLKRGRSELRRVLTALANDERPLTSAEQVEFVETLTLNAGPILQRKAALIDEIESGFAAARAQYLLKSLRHRMNSGHRESDWQRFFQEHPFLLSMIFGRPFVKIADQASVGGRNLVGGGDAITDFLAKNELTNNAALLEIKTPDLNLLSKREYRRSVYAPSSRSRSAP